MAVVVFGSTSLGAVKDLRSRIPCLQHMFGARSETIAARRYNRVCSRDRKFQLSWTLIRRRHKPQRRNAHWRARFVKTASTLTHSERGRATTCNANRAPGKQSTARFDHHDLLRRLRCAVRWTNYLIPVRCQDLERTRCSTRWRFRRLAVCGAQELWCACPRLQSAMHPAATPMRGASGVTRMALHPSRQMKTRLILTSEPSGAVADDSDGSHSPLITAVLQEMSSSTHSVKEISNAPRTSWLRTNAKPAASYCVIVADRRREAWARTRNATVSSGQNTSLDRRG